MEQEIWKNLSIEDIPGEEWRDINGYEGLYQVSNLGRIKSLNYNKTGKEQIRKQLENGGGYLQVELWKNGKSWHPLVHRLVAEEFIPNPDNLPEVNHKNENKKMNTVENLEWCNHKYNINYGTARERMVEKLINRKDLSKPVLCVETGVEYISAREAERQLGVYNAHIIKCCQGKRKTTGGYHWKYTD